MKTVAVIILEQFADWESTLLTPVLQQFAGYTVRYVSTDRNPKTSMGNLRVQPDLTLDELPPDTAALILNGATQSWRDLSDENRLKIADLVRTFKQQGRIVGGICEGTYFLAANGLLNDSATPPTAWLPLPIYPNTLTGRLMWKPNAKPCGTATLLPPTARLLSILLSKFCLPWVIFPKTLSPDAGKCGSSKVEEILTVHTFYIQRSA